MVVAKGQPRHSGRRVTAQCILAELLQPAFYATPASSPAVDRRPEHGYSSLHLLTLLLPTRSFQTPSAHCRCPRMALQSLLHHLVPTSLLNHPVPISLLHSPVPPSLELPDTLCPHPITPKTYLLTLPKAWLRRRRT